MSDLYSTIKGIINPFSYATRGQPGIARMSNYQHLLVDAGLPPFAELVRDGRVFSAVSGVIANAVAPVADLPTTASMYSLFNGNLVGSNIYLILLHVAKFNASGTAGLGQALIVGVSPTVQAAAVSKGTGVIGPNNNNPGSSRTSAAVMGNGTTLAGTPAWQVVGGSDQPAAVEVGAGTPARLDGLFIVPPQFAFGMHVLSPAGTAAKYGGSFMWAELQLDLN